ncbi:hypothetical protein AGABI1DRAFT_115175 [Agaricus bisporus var. burnettii JB137-S8]|uniref:Uncharacterized protein n=1 Tax=Agaricus bisporus var. burnettii (strain JB137-S8 / ATCC MYA-4627 / FGSC 10392) TaxID=597362 RepID=K5WQM0_AGABU|nr:uncharacterized protein AGABI1DRAFT_115175 [Agaricus bisporus var. burnettii JB137-S8]EKM77621.1 hypothetical protein AGABI1DRAFT_115175 [Agaricus bisporus var. burnettii JB137-S8]
MAMKSDRLCVCSFPTTGNYSFQCPRVQAANDSVGDLNPRSTVVSTGGEASRR